MRDEIRYAAYMMKCELESNRLTVHLAPSRIPEIAATGGKIRVVGSTNAPWYVVFCRSFPSGRLKSRNRKKPDTLIKRHHTIRALGEIESGRCITLMAQRLLPYVVGYANRLNGSGAHEDGFFDNLVKPIPWPVNVLE